MKNILSIIVLFLTSCLSPSLINVATFVDYSTYDCFITESNSVSFEYTPLGSVSSQYSNYFSPEMVQSNINPRPRVTHSEALNEAIKTIVEEVKKNGGNGIINFRYEGIYEQGNQTGWIVNGMAIKK